MKKYTLEEAQKIYLGRIEVYRQFKEQQLGSEHADARLGYVIRKTILAEIEKFGRKHNLSGDTFQKQQPYLANEIQETQEALRGIES